MECWTMLLRPFVAIERRKQIGITRAGTQDPGLRVPVDADNVWGLDG